MNRDVNGWLASPGILLAMIACNVLDCRQIIGFMIASFILLFFSFQENRNPKRLKRLWMLAKKGRPQW